MISERITGAFLMMMVIAVVALLVFLGLIATSIRENSRLAEPVVVETHPPSLPPVRQVSNPVALLVLDVSGSMTHSDPAGEQAGAVRAFLRLYHTLVQDALKPGDAARVAVILFGSAAQVVKWPGQQGGGVFLSLPDSAAELERVLNSDLLPMIEPKNGKDPRRGAFTDYLAALRQVNRLLESLKGGSPPLIVFMSDGEDNPFWPMAIETSSDRLEVIDQLCQEVSRKVEKDYRDQPLKIQTVKRGAEILLGASNPPPTDLTVGQSVWDVPRDYIEKVGRELSAYLLQALSNHKLKTSVEAKRRKEIQAILQNIDEREFAFGKEEKGMPLMFQFVYLGKKERALEYMKQLARNVSQSSRFWQLSDQGVTQCKTADQLQGTFISTLAYWLHLQRQDLPERAGEFYVEPNTRGLALTARASPHAQRLVVRDPEHNELALVKVAASPSAADWVLAINQPKPGRWMLSPSDRIHGATLWARRRYVWAFGGLPREFSPFYKTAEVTLGLFDAVNAKQESPSNIYRPTSLPSQAEVQVLQSNAPVKTFKFDAQKGADGTIWEYRHPMPELATLAGDSFELVGRLDGLVYQGDESPVPTQVARATVQRLASVHWQLQNREGRPLADISIQKIVPGCGDQPVRP